MLTEAPLKTCRKCGEVKVVTEYLRRRYEENPEYLRRWREEHPEYMRRWGEENAEARREYNRRWREDNPELRAQQHRNRRALVWGAEGTHTAADVFWLEEAQACLCAYCGVPLPLEPVIHVDHKLPLSRGGSNDPSNLVLACAHCNLSKGAKTAQEYIAYRQEVKR